MAKKTRTSKSARASRFPATAKALAQDLPAKAPAPAEAPPAKAKKAKRAAKAPRVPKDKKMSALDAAAKVVGEAGEPMTTGAMIEAMAAKGYWSSPGGKTPAATLHAAISKEIKTKGQDSRFTKTERGKFGRSAI